MKSNGQKRSVSVALVMAAILALVVPVGAWAQEVTLIPGPDTTLPDYIGAPAKAHPTANSGVPQNPFLAPNPFNSAHVDPWMSDTVDIAGPLGRDPEVLSSTLAEARNHPDDSEIFHCVGAAFDSHGHLLTACTGTGPSGQEASVVLADAGSLEVLAHYHLPTPADSLSALSACYWYFDNRDRFTISAGPNRIITLVEGGSKANLELIESQDDGYDLSGVVPDDDRIAGVMADWQGRIWFVTAGVGEDTARACVLNPARYPDVKCQPLGENEKIFNTFAVTKTGAYVVTSEKMYRVWAGSDDDPYVVWSEPYATIDEVRPGQYELGSGTSPTILGEGKYVAITDNAERLQVVVFRTDEPLGPKETRKVCEVPVFDFEGGRAGANSNLLIGSRLLRKRPISLTLIVTVILALAFTSIANAKGPGKANKSEPETSQNLIPTMQQVNAGRGNADAFVAQLKRHGVVVPEGAMARFPLEERCCPDDSEVPAAHYIPRETASLCSHGRLR